MEPDEDLRLQCLQLAVAHAKVTGGDPIELAGRLLAFIRAEKNDEHEPS